MTGAAPGSGPLAGEVVVVTGGARGIGEAIVALAREQGAEVGVIDLEDVPGDHAVVADVSDAAQVAEAVATLADRLGPATVLVNNAGRNVYADPVGLTEKEWDDFFGVDLKAAWLCSKAVLPSMLAQRRGSIVNVASLHARLTQKGMFPYAPSPA